MKFDIAPVRRGLLLAWTIYLPQLCREKGDVAYDMVAKPREKS